MVVRELAVVPMVQEAVEVQVRQEQVVLLVGVVLVVPEQHQL
jgi:hypothetical protein